MFRNTSSQVLELLSFILDMNEEADVEHYQVLEFVLLSFILYSNEEAKMEHYQFFRVLLSFILDRNEEADGEHCQRQLTSHFCSWSLSFVAEPKN